MSAPQRAACGVGGPRRPQQSFMDTPQSSRVDRSPQHVRSSALPPQCVSWSSPSFKTELSLHLSNVPIFPSQNSFNPQYFSSHPSLSCTSFMHLMACIQVGIYRSSSASDNTTRGLLSHCQSPHATITARAALQRRLLIPTLGSQNLTGSSEPTEQPSGLQPT